MSTFKPMQYRSAKTTPSVKQRVSMLRPTSGVGPPQVPLISEQGSSSQRQDTTGFTLDRIPIDDPLQTPRNTFEEHRENHTLLPDKLKAGIESLSGLSMDDVQVHYNSPKPALLQALAYAQGKDIYVETGQEQHLPHEAWHVVQQKRGRVKPTVQKKGMAMNNDEELEREADMMGAMVARMPRATQMQFDHTPSIPSTFPSGMGSIGSGVLQAKKVRKAQKRRNQRKKLAKLGSDTGFAEELKAVQTNIERLLEVTTRLAHNANRTHKNVDQVEKFEEKLVEENEKLLKVHPNNKDAIDYFSAKAAELEEEANKLSIPIENYIEYGSREGEGRITIKSGDEFFHLGYRTNQNGERDLVFESNREFEQKVRDWQMQINALDATQRGTAERILTRIELLKEDLKKASQPAKVVGQIGEAIRELSNMLKSLGASGAYILYRGFHFRKTLSTAEYTRRVNESEVGKATFSHATYDLAAKMPGGINAQNLEQAAQQVQDELATVEHTGGQFSRYGKKQAFNLQTRQMETRLAAKGYYDKGDFRGLPVGIFDNPLHGMLHKYVNHMYDFEQDMAHARERQKYGHLSFEKNPFISTTSNARQAILYAKGEKASNADQQRTQGEVGRVYIYTLTPAEITQTGGLDVLGLHRKDMKVNTTTRLHGEQEITFRGEIPGKFLTAQVPVKGNDDPNKAAQKLRRIGLRAAHNTGQGGMAPRQKLI